MFKRCPSWRRRGEFIRTHDERKSSPFGLLFDLFDSFGRYLVLSVCIAEVVSDDDFVLVQDDFADGRLNDELARFDIVLPAVDDVLQESFQHLYG